ncbi:hypothetical protein HN51_057606 [Arachis hypogaea]|uniref:DUF7026 domain-containing protein n=1 Tax=Arachis hypogaea TaxID=3818 RepID=A0A444WXS4_ARAHY|nr:uncharacterized protein LOC107623048 [Arachis ipaensis]XP_025683722.1 uncharacterized protein LOC112784648 [Arachis hypogaea]QHN80512.1 uncharacterized protein DS421_20g678860 [Arachis hypogaea]RYQ82203.1 hypothetical protein Ahy_B10g100803 [Arachis hypogaea]
MALRIHVIPTPRLFSSSSSSTPITTHLFSARLNTRISCTKNNNNNSSNKGISDATLATELGIRITGIRSRVKQTEQAINKSRHLLFRHLCEYMGLNEDNAKLQWTKMEDSQKWALVQGFVAEWGALFHPLSARSTKDMVEEYLKQGNGTGTGAGNPSTDSASSLVHFVESRG